MWSNCLERNYSELTVLGKNPRRGDFPGEKLPRGGRYPQENYSGVIVQGVIVLGQGEFHGGQISGGSCAYHVYAFSKTAIITLEKDSVKMTLPKI